MSKLNLVRQALTTNPNVVLVHTEDRNCLDADGPYLGGALWAETPTWGAMGPRAEPYYFFNHLCGLLIGQLVSFYVAPKKSLYSVKELQDFMFGLTPGLEHDAKGDFQQSETHMRVGWLGYDDKIGNYTVSMQKEIKLTDKDLFDQPGFLHGVKEVNVARIANIARRTLIHVLPDKAIGRDGLEGKLPSTHDPDRIFIPLDLDLKTLDIYRCKDITGM